METSSPMPSFIPHNATEVQELQLLHQVQSGHMPVFNALILGILLRFPLPESWFSIQSRLDLYYAFTGTSSPISNVVNSHPVITSILVIFWPLTLILGLALLYFLIKTIFSLSQFLFPILFGRFMP